MTSEKINKTDPSHGPSFSSKQIYLMAAFAVIIILLVVSGLLLPPFSLGQRLAAKPATAVTNISALHLPDGLQLKATEAELAQIDAVTAVTLSPEMQTALPANTQAVTPVYQIQFQENSFNGQTALALPAQLDDTRRLDLYGWNGQSWQFLPSQLKEGWLETLPGMLPAAVAVMQTSPNASPTLAADISTTTEQTTAVGADYVTDSTTAVLHLDENGAIVGEVTAVVFYRIRLPQW